MGNPLRFIDPSGNMAEDLDGHSEPVEKPKDGCGNEEGFLCLWMGQNPAKQTAKPPTPIGPNG
jgi:hypothetical protein